MYKLRDPECESRFFCFENQEDYDIIANENAGLCANLAEG